ncbi:SacI homology domain-containing protein [Entophlyctis helioformis]|nr:SacI homology domain-containing protein [Entophlyctis helioformis]
MSVSQPVTCLSRDPTSIRPHPTSTFSGSSRSTPTAHTLVGGMLADAYAANLYMTQIGSLVLEPIQAPPESRMLLAFDPLDGRFAVEDHYDTYIPTSHLIAKQLKYYGIVGLLDLVFAKYIFVVVGREMAATTVHGTVRVWRITAVEALPIWKQAVALSLDEEEHERICLRAITNELTTGNLYFSRDVDLTNGPQSAYNRGVTRLLNKTIDSETYFGRINNRFFWNRHLLEPFLGMDTRQFVLPLICGHVGSTILSLDGPPVAIILVSRMNHYQAGTRYWRRGVNQNGHAAMEVETDVLVMYHGGLASFCMIRGSVPLMWSQSGICDPIRRPPIDLSYVRSPESLQAMTRHFEYLMSIYGNKVDVIDMLERHRSSSTDIADLSIAYETALRDWNHPSIRCHRGFMEEIPELVKQQGYFHARRSNGPTPDLSAVERKQLGVIRVNSLDCVDETSISQFYIARHTLQVLLRDVGSIKTDSSHQPSASRHNGQQQSEAVNPGESPNRRNSIWNVDCHAPFDPATEFAIRKLWADNSDALSCCYTGTPMLYTGRIKPMMFSGFSLPILMPIRSTFVALARTYMSHFQDFKRQDNIEYFMGLLDEHATTAVAVRRHGRNYSSESAWSVDSGSGNETSGLLTLGASTALPAQRSSLVTSPELQDSRQSNSSPSSVTSSSYVLASSQPLVSDNELSSALAANGSASNIYINESGLANGSGYVTPPAMQNGSSRESITGSPPSLPQRVFGSQISALGSVLSPTTPPPGPDPLPADGVPSSKPPTPPAVSIAPAKLARLQRTAAMQGVKSQILLRRRLSQHELTQPPLLSLILLFRKFTAPTHVNTARDFVLAMVWLAVYYLCMRILSYPPSFFIRRPRRQIDWSSLPAYTPPAPHGIAIYARRHSLPRAGSGNMLDAQAATSAMPTALPSRLGVNSNLQNRKMSGR